MRSRRIGPLLAVACSLLMASGCGYVHFGRMPEAPPAAPLGDEQLLKENANLRTEKKILQQELALTRAQGDALRMAIENRTSDGDTSKRLTEKLTQTTRELATLRADYAKLQMDRAAAPANPAEIADLKSKLGATEDKLAASLKNYTQLQEEIGHLRTDLDKSRTENTALTEQVKVVTAKNEAVQAALAQLNADLLAQKNSRAAAEQDAATLRTQLDTANTKLSTLGQQRTASAAEARSLGAADAALKPADASDLRGQLDALRKKVWSLEGERNELQQKVAALEAAGKTPALGDVQARAESEAKLTAALESAKMLRDENDHLKANKASLETELAKTRSAVPLAAQAQSLRDQLIQAQSQAAALVDENSKLKARLAMAGGTASVGNPSALGSGNATPPPAATPAPGGVTATFVTNIPSTSGPAGTGNAALASARNHAPGSALRFHTVASGDTLSKISNTYYGTPARWAEILVANRDILGEDNNLVIGRTLRIP